MRPNNILIISIFTLLIVSSCSKDGFRKDELQRITNGGENEIMSLFTVNSPSDSLLLRQNAREIKERHVGSESVQYLRKRMLATVNDPKNPGVGIAAPQVGISVRMIYVQRLDKEGEPFEIYYNPKIEKYGSDLKQGLEGCLSVPDYRGTVERAQTIKLSYLDSVGVERKEEIKGFVAVIFQHEIDHMNGVLYYDHIDDGFNALSLE